MFLTRSEYDRSVWLGGMGSGNGWADSGPGLGLGSAVSSGQPHEPKFWPGQGRRPLSQASAVFPRLDLRPSASVVLPLSHCWVPSRCGSVKLRFVLRQRRLMGPGTLTFNPGKAKSHPLFPSFCAEYDCLLKDVNALLGRKSN